MRTEDTKREPERQYIMFNAMQHWVTILLCLTITDLMGAEIDAFRITDVNSELALRYLYDEQTFYSSGNKTQQDIRPTFQEEYRIDTESYIYHPNLLTMDLGGSILLDQSRVETLTDENSNNEQLLGYNARLDFLKNKPYPASVYYSKENPSVSVGVGGRFLMENIRYGIDMALLEPISPVQVTFNAYRQSANGEGFDQLTDDTVEHANLRLDRSYGKGNYVQLTYQINNRDSSSGSPGLPIQERTTSNTGTFFDSKNLFGNARQLQLITNIAYTTQDEFPRREELRAYPVLNWQHNDKINSFYRFLYTDSEEESQNVNQKLFTSGFGYNDNKKTFGSADIHIEDSKNTGLEYQSRGANYAINYNQPVAIGSITAGYSGAVDYRDQTAETAVFTIFGEEHELIGTTQVNLSRQFVVDSSIVVSNTGRSQIYIEDLDYRVLRVGSTTQIQRLASGNILDGQAVLVDYDYLTGGTFAYNLVNNNLQLQWNLSRYYELYIRYRDSQQKLREGNPTIPLNSITSYTYGGNASQPLLNGITLGGQAYIQDHYEDINPFLLHYLDAYTDLPLPRMTKLRLSMRRQLIDNENSVEDVDLTAYLLRLQARPWLRTQMSYEFNHETDTGGTLKRLLKIQRLQFRWAFRQLSLSANANYTQEQQGNTDRDRWSIRVNMLRSF